MSEIVIKNIVKEWPGVRAVDNVSFKVEESTFTILLGPSGCGKSTILRMIAGLESVTSGSIHINGEDITKTDPSNRGISMVFQSYALFPHLNVKENILFGLKVRKAPRKLQRIRLQEAVEMVGLSEYLERKPAQLSGGQRQRVALARTIVSGQSICLMDEPLSNLDAKLRAEMRDEIKSLQQQLGLTVLFVTHDQTEAMTMADQIILLKDGRIEQSGTPYDLYSSPSSIFAARFIGSPPMNIISPGDLGVVTKSNAGNGKVLLGLRPEVIAVGGNTINGPEMEVAGLDYLGSETLVHLVRGESRLIAKLSGECELKENETVKIHWPASAEHYFNHNEIRPGQ
mgnify:CR=1 FL=1